MTQKNKGGRPSKFEPWMCEEVVELMEEGASKAEVAATLGITRDTMVRWTKEIEMFSDAVKRGEELSEAWWQRMGRINLFDPYQGAKFNSTLWYMNMKNRFGWKDKQEVEHSGNADNPVVVINAGANPYAK